MGAMRNYYYYFFGKLEAGDRGCSLMKTGHIWKNNIKTDPKKTACESLVSKHLQLT